MHKSSRKKFITQKSTPKVKSGKVQRKNFRDVAIIRPALLQIRFEVPGLGYQHVLTVEDIYKFIKILPEWKKLSIGLDEIILANEDCENSDGWYDAEKGILSICAWEQQMHRICSPSYYEEHADIFRSLGVPCSETGGCFLFSIHHNYSESLDKGEFPSNVLEQLEREYNFRLCKFELEIINMGLKWYLTDTKGIRILQLLKMSDGIDIYEREYICKFTKETVRAYQLLHIFLHELGHHYDSINIPKKRFLIRGESYAEQYANKYWSLIWERYVKEFGFNVNQIKSGI